LLTIEFSRDERKKQVRWQSSENNDDITALQYHPSSPTLLLSGGDDGLVSIFDTAIDDENDSLMQAFDFAPIHKAGFLSDTAMYALSSDQKFSIYPVNHSEPDDSEVLQPVLFGDLRPTTECDYVIDVLRDINHPYVVTGSNLRYEA
jgi:WD repeat-containing protein 89